MKSLLTLLCAAALSNSMAIASPVKILFLNTPSITINGKDLKVGDTFDDAAPIKWASDRQAMKVQNVSNKKVSLVAARQAKNCASLADFFTKTNHLSTRGDGLMGLEGLEEFLNDTFPLLDPIEVESMLETTETAYFIAKYEIEGKDYACRLRGTESSFTIDNTLFAGIAPGVLPDEVHVRIYYHEDGEETDELVSDKTIIIPVLESIEAE